MLGLLFIFFIGKYFYKLAETYNKSKWGFAILSIVIYYATTFFTGFALGIVYVLLGSDIETINELAIRFICVIAGLLCCVGLYYVLEKKWKKEQMLRKNVIDDIGKRNPL